MRFLYLAFSCSLLHFSFLLYAIIIFLMGIIYSSKHLDFNTSGFIWIFWFCVGLFFVLNQWWNQYHWRPWSIFFPSCLIVKLPYFYHSITFFFFFNFVIILKQLCWKLSFSNFYDPFCFLLKFMWTSVMGLIHSILMR